ncbi:hypothetical protein DFH11DRAFT_1879936 [Phellopilus nigrolimitatus]|nr:hypothetical protein DFH11DRAFT_1879936 [Phellopilus nigrolimitatus]
MTPLWFNILTIPLLSMYSIAILVRPARALYLPLVDRPSHFGLTDHRRKRRRTQERGDQCQAAWRTCAPCGERTWLAASQREEKFARAVRRLPSVSLHGSSAQSIGISRSAGMDIAPRKTWKARESSKWAARAPRR